VGDTVYGESECVDKRESASRPQQGIVTVHSRLFQQEGKLVCEFDRTMLIWRRGFGTMDD